MMPVNQCNETNPCPLSGQEPIVRIHVSQSTNPSLPVLKPEHIPFFKNLTLSILIPFFHLSPTDICALGMANREFKQKFMRDLEEDHCLGTPSSFMTICRVRHAFLNTNLLANTQENPMNGTTLQKLILLERELGVQLRPFSYIHHLGGFGNVEERARPELVQIGNYTALRSLKLYGSEDFAPVEKFTGLNHLNLHFPKVSLESLPRLTNLKSLTLVEDPGELDGCANRWTAVAKLSSLENFKLSFNKVTYAGLHALQKLSVLRSLSIDISYCSNIVALDLQPLAGNLQELSFFGSEKVRFLQNMDADALGSLTSLKSLKLYNCALTDVAWNEFNKLSTLQTLHLVETGFTINHIAYLSGLTALRELSVTPTNLEENQTELHKFWQLPALQIVKGGILFREETFTRPQES